MIQKMIDYLEHEGINTSMIIWSDRPLHDYLVTLLDHGKVKTIDDVFKALRAVQ